jgi:sugar transferase (PEP-CTERM/EpsH1 system associated)
VPYPLEKGDKLRAFNQLKVLSKRHEIYIFALNDTLLHKEAISILSSFCKEVHIFRLSKLSILGNVLRFLFTGKPLQCGYFYNRRAQKKVDKLIASINPDHIYAQLIRTAEYVKNKPIKKTLDYQDLFSKGLYRIMEKSSAIKRRFVNIEYKRVKKYEKEIFNLFDNKTIITQEDKNLFDCIQKEELVVVPNGVDTSFFKPILSIEKDYDLIFTGNMSYTPNVDAAEYIAKQILPHLLKKYPNIRILLCGAAPSHRVSALKNEYIEVSGWVEDIRPFYAKSRIFIAPMQLGTGLQNKLLEAMAMQIPCVTSPLAGKPLGAMHGKELFICNNIDEYVEAIDILLQNADRYKIISENAYTFVHANFNWESTTKLLENLIINTK